MSTNYLLFAVLFVLALVALIFAIRNHIRLNRLFKGSKAASLEGLLQEIVRHIESLDTATETHGEQIAIIGEKLKRQGHGVKIMRFNPFTDVGGTQSFAVAIVNEEGDGVVFSSLYSRERMSVFAKPVTGGKSDVELTKEEATVITEAQKEAVR